jgi:hypothetical protein
MSVSDTDTLPAIDERSTAAVPDEIVHVPASLLAEARFTLACVLVDAGQSRARAVALARMARDGYRDVGERPDAALAEIETWLDEHEGGP